MRRTWHEPGRSPRSIQLVARLIAISLSFPALLQSAGAAEPTTRPAPVDAAVRIKTWFAELASPDGKVREEAAVNLMGLKAAELPELRKAIEENLPLAPAQATVLRPIVTQVFLAGEAYEATNEGFLGIRMDDTQVSLREGAGVAEDGEPVTGVVVTYRVPGFAGARMLHDGDVLLSIVERPRIPLHTRELASAVREMPAGRTLHFVVLRQGQVITVAMTLGARPSEADRFLSLDDFTARRQAKADAYWDREYATLLKEGTS